MPSDDELAVARADPRRRLGHFLLLGEIGRGGMGAVHRAWDERLRRIVAVKVILVDDEEAIARFRREAAAVARVRHPHIVTIHDVGSVDGRHYIAMDLLEGVTLTARLGARREGGEPLPLFRAVEILRDASRALAHAHDLGVVHRDVKPSNILVGEGDHAWVVDFGLALIDGETSRITRTNALVGTPSYMSPEQADGSRSAITGLTDVYGLGATLYFVLTGRAPFEGDPVRVLHDVLIRDPRPPSTRNRRVPDDLETICLRCLEKAPDRRYPSAHALADDLDAWLAGEPIAARPLGPVRRFVRRARRNLLVTALVAVAAVGVIGGGGIAIALTVDRWRMRERAIAEVRAERDAAERARADAELARSEADAARLDADERAAANERLVARSLAQRARVRLDEGRRREAVALAAASIGRDDDPGARALHYLARQGPWRAPRRIGGDLGQITAVGFAPDGDLLAAATVDGLVLLHESGGELRARIGHGARVRTLAFSPSGDRLVTAGDGGAVRSWDRDGRPLSPSIAAGAPVRTIAWSPDGATLATAGQRGLVRLWRADSGEELARIDARGGSIASLAWRPDGTLIATGAEDGSAAVWDPRTGSAVMRAPAHRNGTQGVAWTPDGAWLVSGGLDKTVAVWDVAARRELFRLEGHEAFVQAVAASSDGRWLASASWDDTVRLIDAESGRLRAVLDPRVGQLDEIAFSPDGDRILVGGRQGALLLYDLSPEPDAPVVFQHGQHVAALAWSPDGSLLAASGGPTTVSLWNAATGRHVRTLPGHDAPSSALAFSPDGRILATASWDGTVGLFDVAGRSPALALRGHEAQINGLAWSPGGERIATAGNDRTVRLWDAAQRAELRRATLDARILSVAWSPDGGRIVAVTDDGALRLLDADTAAVVVTRPAAHEGAASTVVFSGDGTRVVTGGDDRAVRVWDAATLAPLATRHGHAGRLLSVSADHDGRLIAGGDVRRRLALWDPARSRPLLEMVSSTSDAPVTVALSPDGRRLAAGNMAFRGQSWILPVDVALGRDATAHDADGLRRAAEAATGLTVPDDGLDPVPVDRD